MMMMGLHFMGEVPFKKVYIHALVRDAKGQKMSKSKGNIIDPLELTEKYGADALRFSLTAMAAQGRDIKLSEDRVEGYRNFATKLWNAARYAEMNECKPAAGFDAASATYAPNRWIIAEVLKTKETMEKAIESYRFNEAAMAIYQFAWNTFCDWYLEFTKPLLQNDSQHTEEIRATTAWTLDQIMVLLNPIMPFITEELYAAMGERDRPLIASAWPQYEGLKADDTASADMGWLCDMISEIRSVRADMNVPAGAKIDLLIKDASEVTQERLKKYEEIIQRMARIETIEVVTDIPKGSVQSVVVEATIGLPIADIIDLDAERARLKKQIGKLEQDIKKIEQKLGNKKFLDNAPEEIVAEQHARKQEAEATRTKLAQALEQLEAA
jgi:valyl-tRNA synthetase